MANLSSQAVSERLTKAESSSSGPVRQPVGGPTMGRGSQGASGGYRLQMSEAALRACPLHGIPPEELLTGRRLAVLPARAELSPSSTCLCIRCRTWPASHTGLTGSRVAGLAKCMWAPHGDQPQQAGTQSPDCSPLPGKATSS